MKLQAWSCLQATHDGSLVHFPARLSHTLGAPSPPALSRDDACAQRNSQAKTKRRPQPWRSLFQTSHELYLRYKRRRSFLFAIATKPHVNKHTSVFIMPQDPMDPLSKGPFALFRHPPPPKNERGVKTHCFGRKLDHLTLGRKRGRGIHVWPP